MSLWARLLLLLKPKNAESAQKFVVGILGALAFPILVVTVIFSPGSTTNTKDAYEKAYDEIGCPVETKYILEDIRAFDSFADMEAYENMSKEEAVKRLKEVYLDISNETTEKKCFLKKDDEIIKSLKEKFKLTDKEVNELLENVYATRNGRQNFSMPLKPIEVVKPFDKDVGFTILDSDENAKVYSMGDGIVKDIRTNSEKINIDDETSIQKGLTITIEYENNKGLNEDLSDYKTEKLTVVYAMMINPKVNVGDTIANGQELGDLSHSYLYIMMQDADGKYVNPKTYLNLKNPKGKYIIPFKHFNMVISEVGNRGSDFHCGMDLDGGKNGEVLAFNDSTVIRTSSNCAPFGGSIGNKCPSDDNVAWGAGNYVMVSFKKDKKNYYALYAHLSKVNVHVGDKLVSGDLIGLQGSSGNSSGTHLHLEIHEGTLSSSPIASKKGLMDPRVFIDFKDGKLPHTDVY